MTVPGLRAGVSLVETDYGIALLAERTGEYWTLNPSGVVVLRALLAGRTAAQGAQEVAGEYSVDIETATRDAQELEDQLRAAGLVE